MLFIDWTVFQFSSWTHWKYSTYTQSNRFQNWHVERTGCWFQLKPIRISFSNYKAHATSRVEWKTEKNGRKKSSKCHIRHTHWKLKYENSVRRLPYRSHNSFSKTFEQNRSLTHSCSLWYKCIHKIVCASGA